MSDKAEFVDTYVYQPLDNLQTEIRLLRLKPGHTEEEIECSLFHASLRGQEVPRYETVSYCWGDTTLRSTINLDGISTNVPASSAQALCALRLLDTPRILWIDALCINQSDVSEKNQQVALMCDIYRNTVRNLVYLGDSTGSTEHISRDLDAVLQNIRSETSDYADMLHVLYDENDAFRLSPTGLSAEVNLESLIHFYSLPWFRRVWVSQEAALSRTSMCYWGQGRFSLTDVLKVAVWLTHKANHLPSQLAWCKGVLAAAEMFDYAAHDVNPTPEEPPKLLALLVQHHNLGAHDPRDHVYGILGLYQGHEKQQTLPSALRPDYGKPLAEVCLDASRIAIEEQGDLQIFLHLFHRDVETDEERDFPSWVPRWHRSWDRNVDASRLSYFFRASEGMESSAIEIEGGNLSVKGAVIDTVSKLTAVISNSDIEDPEFLRCLIETAKQFMSRRETPPHNSSNQRLGHIFQAGRTSEGRALDDERASSFTHFAELILAGQMPLALHGTEAEQQPLTNKSIEAAKVHHAMRRACVNRRLCVTQGGRLGLGPRTTKEGDLICNLSGSLWPVVLRNCGEDHRIVGVCYIEGVMFGEAVQEGQRVKWHDELFVIA